MTAMLIAATRMTGNIIAAAVLLGVGVAILRLLRRKGNRQRGLPLIAFLAGPASAAFYLSVDYIWIQPYNYRTLDDAIHTIIPVLVVGCFGGAVGAIVFWIGGRVRTRRLR